MLPSEHRTPVSCGPIRHPVHVPVHEPQRTAVAPPCHTRPAGIALAHGSKGPAEKLDIQFHDSPTPPETAGDLKHGKVDPDNTPHVGGNQWAGGTGGTDTAGLGGRVGPYRLDAGHPVHQVSDEEKASVPEEVCRPVVLRRGMSVYCSRSGLSVGLWGRDASSGKGPQRWPQKRLDRGLEAAAKAVGGGYCWLQMPLSLALAATETVAEAGRPAGGGGGAPPRLPMHPWFGVGSRRRSACAVHLEGALGQAFCCQRPALVVCQCMRLVIADGPVRPVSTLTVVLGP